MAMLVMAVVVMAMVVMTIRTNVLKRHIHPAICNGLKAAVATASLYFVSTAYHAAARQRQCAPRKHLKADATRQSGLIRCMFKTLASLGAPSSTTLVAFRTGRRKQRHICRES
eukprot:3050819-Pleurochrysis_carterae.AAC.3